MLTLLLAFAVGFSCIGCAAWFCTKGQIADIDADYTTIAVPLPQNNEYITQRWLNVGGLPGEDGNIYWFSNGYCDRDQRHSERRLAESQGAGLRLL